MKFTFYGHACFAVELLGKTLLFDPYITPNPMAKHINIDKIKPDYILVSHGHGDHIADVVAIAQNTDALVIGSVEVINWLLKQANIRTHEMNYGSFEFDFGTITFVPATHSSSMPDGTYGGNPGGFVIESNQGNFYYSGDTGLSKEMELIGKLSKLNFAVLPIGGNYTMNARQALIAAQMIDCVKIIGVHYNTFPPITINLNDAKSLFGLGNKELLLPTIGESLELN